VLAVLCRRHAAKAMAGAVLTLGTSRSTGPSELRM
jgi:hypothetical protein